MRCDEAPLFKICEHQGCRPTKTDVPSQGRTKWNETKWKRWVWRNTGMRYVAGENGTNSEKNLLRLRFVLNKTHTEWPRCEIGITAVEGEHLTACTTESVDLLVSIKLNMWPYSSDGWLKRLMPDGSAGRLVLIKALSLNLNFSFLTGFRYFATNSLHEAG